MNTPVFTKLLRGGSYQSAPGARQGKSVRRALAERGSPQTGLMGDPPSAETVRAGLSEDEMRETFLRLVFAGDQRRLDEFCSAIQEYVPESTAVTLRGSSVTGKRWDDGAPFDADGPGTSDLDLTLVGADVLGFYDTLTGFYIPGVHSKPLSEKDPDICPTLVPLRRRLMGMVRRPVNIQGTRDWIMFVREHLMGQPYLTLMGKLESS